MKPSPLQNLRIASPCPQNWEQMEGDARARFCGLCNLHVCNIAELTQKQATALITQTEGRICGRIYRRADGTVITKDCPFGLRAIRRRVARVTGAIFATVVALSSAVLGQKPAKNSDSSCKQQVTISRKQSDSEAGVITGTILDPYGAVIVGARIRITEQISKKSVEATSDEEGCFRIAASSTGTYDLVVESAGFNKLEVAQLTVASKETVTLTLVPALPGTTVIVGVIGETPMIDTSKPGGTTIITADIIRRLPLP